MVLIKRIAFVITGIHHISGIASATALIANELAKTKEFDITLITLTDRSNTEFVNVNENVKVIKIFDKKVNLKLRLFEIIYRLNRIFNDNKFDIVIAPALIFYILHFASGENRKSKLIAWDHASIPLKKDIFSLKYVIRKIAAEKSDAMVVITKKAKSVYLQQYKKLKKIVQIYNTIDELTNGENNYNSNSKKILSAGALENIKGFDLAIDVARIALSDHPDWQWHIYGEGKERENLQELIIKYRLENQVKLMGYTNKLKDVYKNYSFYVLTSRSESFGMVILEAQKSNLPVIAFDCPYGPNELIENEMNGFIIKSYDVEKMADRIIEMIRNPNLRMNMSSKSMILSGNMKKDNIVSQWKSLLSDF
ncbi:glycosyltransferase [Sporosalibacterium faouarense]|uniref:glycosyltransferase n=1 Tax=Sporosalibacterium faouarense TaxID=516123 RepID=UPI00192BFD80